MLVSQTTAYAQGETTYHQSVADSLTVFYNSAVVEKVFDLFSPDMQQALPRDQTISFFSGLKREVGNITERKFLRFENSYIVYVTKFDKATLLMQLSLDDKYFINGLFFKPYIAPSENTKLINETKLILPFKDEWTVVWGGDTKELNYHVEHQAQKNAFDFVITNNHGRSYKTDGKANEDYFAFGMELFAPCEASVVLVVDGVHDNVPGVLNPIYVPGNTVILKTINNEYLFFAHFKKHSILVKEGDTCQTGTIARSLRQFWEFNGAPSSLSYSG